MGHQGMKRHKGGKGSNGLSGPTGLTGPAEQKSVKGERNGVCKMGT